MAKHHKHGKHQNRSRRPIAHYVETWDRTSVVDYWLEMEEYYSDHGDSAYADWAFDCAAWSESAEESEFQTQCALWSEEDQQYWASLPVQMSLLAAQGEYDALQ